MKSDGEEAPVSTESGPRSPEHCIVGGAHAFILRVRSQFTFELNLSSLPPLDKCKRNIRLVVILTAEAQVTCLCL